MNVNVSMKSPLLLQQFGSGGMIKSTKEKLERQQTMQSKVAFFEAQKQNLKNTECDTLEGIARKLEMIHSYNDQIDAAKQEYNNSQMFHILDEAKEAGEKIAEAAEKNKPKTKEEREKDIREEALGTDEEKGALTELTEELLELTEDMTEETGETMEQMEEIDDIAEQMEENADIIGKWNEQRQQYFPIDIKI